MSPNPKLQELLQDAPIIAAVKNDEGLDRALGSDCAVIFFLYGSICTIGSLTERVKAAGKRAFVHLDLIEGLAGKDVAVDFIANNTNADGIISTRPNLIRRGRTLGLLTIQRFFMLDSLAFDNVLRQASDADAVDILPGTMPKIINRLSARIRQPIIASGLISDKEDIFSALGAGAVAISSTNAELWFL